MYVQKLKTASRSGWLAYVDTEGSPKLDVSIAFDRRRPETVDLWITCPESEDEVHIQMTNRQLETLRHAIDRAFAKALAESVKDCPL